MNPVDDRDLHRMDDDGAPPPREPKSVPPRIGIAPGTDAVSTLKLVGEADAEVVRASRPPDVVLTSEDPEATETLRVVFTDSEVAHDTREEKVVDNGGIVLKDVRPVRERRHVHIPADENGPSRRVKLGGGDGPIPGPSMLVGANGLPISATPEPVELVGVTGETLNSLTWPDYLAWRKTKCRPYDYEKGPALATVVPEGGLREFCHRGLEEIDQATLEFIGEVAELGDLFCEHGPTLFWGEKRDKLIDECGDIFFCGAWALDAWGVNPLVEMTEDLELMRIADNDDLAAFAGVIAGNDPRIVLGNARFISMLGGLIFNLLLRAQSSAGLTANSFKKLKYQRREQAVEKQVERILTTLLKVNQILIVANSSVEEALKVNMRKLNARYPDGYKPGRGGGIRTGEGA